MLQKKAAVPNVKSSDTVIGAGIHFENVSIRGMGNIRVDGGMKGVIDLEGHFTIGPEGNVDGDVKAASGTISGTYKGDITITGDLHITTHAHVFGRVQAGNLIVDSGASIAAACFINEDSRSAKERARKNGENNNNEDDVDLFVTITNEKEKEVV